jgi:hypothetical protein
MVLRTRAMQDPAQFVLGPLLWQGAEVERGARAKQRKMSGVDDAANRIEMSPAVATSSRKLSSGKPSLTQANARGAQSGC